MDKITIRGFSEKGNWYKGNLHSHTVNSDGMLTPEQSVSLLKSMDTTFCAFPNMISIRITERNLTVMTSLSCRGLRRPQSFIMMRFPGEEKKYITFMAFSAQRRCREMRSFHCISTMRSIRCINITDNGTGLRLPRNWRMK